MECYDDDNDYATMTYDCNLSLSCSHNDDEEKKEETMQQWCTILTIAISLSFYDVAEL